MLLINITVYTAAFVAAAAAAAILNSSSVILIALTLHDITPHTGTGELHDMFSLFATFGGGSGVSRNSMGGSTGGVTLGVVEMDGTHFAKMCRETGITTKTFTSAAADLIFAKVKTQVR